MKKIITQLLILIVLCSFIKAESISGSISLNEQNFTFTDENGYSKIRIIHKNGQEGNEVGAPSIPFLSITTVVPANATNLSIQLPNLNYNQIKTNINPYPVQKDFISGDTITFTEPNSVLYNGYYPLEAASINHISSLRGTKLINFRINPLRYNGTLQTLELAEHIDYEITYSLVPETPTNNHTFNNVFTSQLQSIVANPENLSEWSSVSNPQNRSISEPVDFLIITSNKLKSAFLTYAAFRSSERNISTEVVTVEDIYNNYTGATNQIKIKACIKDYVENRNIIYVMLGGDVGEVEHQIVWAPETDGTTDIPSDLFYSCLDGDISWNSNGNDKIGEDEDNCDRVSDVILGRLPVNTAQEVYQYIQKITEFKSSYVNKNRRSNTLFFNGGYEDLFEYNSHKKDIDFQIEVLYQPYWPSIKSTYQELLTASEFIDVWNEGYSTIFLANHGLENLILLKGWGDTGEEFTTDAIDHLTQVTNVVYTTACRTAAFDEDQCFGEKLVLHPSAGSLTYMAATRSATFGSSGDYCNLFAKKLSTNPSNSISNTIGNAFNNTAIEYAINYSANVWDLYVKNLLGDPTIVFLENEDKSSIEELILPEGNAIADASISKDGTIYTVTTGNNQQCYLMDKSGTWGTLPLLPNVTISNIAIDNNNYLWATTNLGSIYRLTGRSWELIPGSGWDISANSHGDICLLGTNDIYSWNGTDWVSLNWNGNLPWNSNYTELGITVDEDGNPWIIDPLRDIYKYDGNWSKVPGKASCISASIDGSICIDDFQLWGGIDWIKFDKSEYLTGYIEPMGAINQKYLFLKEGVLYWLHTAENLLVQGYFPGSYWEEWGDEGVLSVDDGNYSYEVNDEPTSTISAPKISVINGGGTELWSALYAQRIRSSINFGETYRVSFWAKQENISNSNNDILVTVSMKETPWTEYGALSVNLSEEYKRYEFEFTMTEETDNDAIIQFCVGKYNRDIYIENVRVDRLTPDRFAPEYPQVKYLLINNENVELEWYPSVDDAVIDHYNLFNSVDKYQTTNTFYSLNTEINKSYFLKLQAVDKTGKSSPCVGIDGSIIGSKSLSLKPIKADRYNPIINKDFKTTETTIAVSWAETDNIEGLIEYAIKYKPLDQLNNSISGLKKVSTQENNALLTGLMINTLYEITVNVLYENSPSAYQTIYIRTGIGDYTTPVRLPIWNSETTYWSGDQISYNGKIYEAKWWTLNEVPGTTSVWEEIVQ